MRLLVLFALLVLSAITIQAQVSAHYINIGQGDSILLEMKSAAILIDAGGEATGDTSDRDHLVEYLNTFFARRPISSHAPPRPSWCPITHLAHGRR